MLSLVIYWYLEIHLASEQVTLGLNGEFFYAGIHGCYGSSVNQSHCAVGIGRTTLILEIKVTPNKPDVCFFLD